MGSEASLQSFRGHVVTKAPPWHLAVTLDLFLSSISSGTFIVAALLLLLSPGKWLPTSAIGFVISFLVEMADLISLVADLGDPRRFHHMLRMMKVRSPMSLGVWLSSGLAVFAFFSSLVSIVILRGSPNLAVLLKVVAAPGLLFALGVAMYKGVLLSATAQPVWGSVRWLGADLSISAGTCGIVTLLAIATVIGDFGLISAMRYATGWMLMLHTVALIIVLADINHVFSGGNKDRVAVLFWNLTATVFGGLLPTILTFVAPPEVPSANYAITVLTLSGTLVFKHTLISIPGRLSEFS
jgi:Ni/Fe-hydrogenase subunit HybB-like protein